MMTPDPQDFIVKGKHGLSAFKGTDLEQQLKIIGIETLALVGFMANCCVESTMREACEKGFNVITLTDCVATTTMAGYQAALDITYPFFSTPMNAMSFSASVLEQAKLGPNQILQELQTTSSYSTLPWDFRGIVGKDVYQVSFSICNFHLLKRLRTLQLK